MRPRQLSLRPEWHLRPHGGHRRPRLLFVRARRERGPFHREPDGHSITIAYVKVGISTYRTIAARAPNDGRLDWLVPPELSSSCLIRVSDAEGIPVQAPEAVLYEFSFKVSRPRELYAPVPGFAVSLEVPDFRLQSGTSLRLEVIPDGTREQVYLAANGF